MRYSRALNWRASRAAPAGSVAHRLRGLQARAARVLHDPAELAREARQFNAREYRILASQPVIDLFLDEESQSLAMVSDSIGKPVSLQVETAYHQEQYDIILM